MKNKTHRTKVLAFFLLFAFPAAQVHAYWVWSPEQGKFVNAEGATQDSAQDDYDYAMKFYRDKNFEEAAKRFEEILKKYPQSRTAPEAQYRLGLVLEEKGDYLKAFKAYKRLVESYPQSERFNEVIEREYKIGNVFFAGRKAKFAGIEILPALPKAVEVFQHIVKNAPYSDFGDKAQFQLGMALKKWNHYGEAIEAFQTVIDQYPKSDLLSQARYELAETSFLRSASNVRDQRALDDASKQVDRFMTRYPDSETAEKAAKMHQEIDEKNAEKNYRIGLYYEKDNYVESALIYYGDVAVRYPQTQWGRKASEKLKSLKEPAKYVNDQQAVYDEQERALENKLKGLDEKKDAVEYDITKRSLERLQKHRKTLDKDKKDSMKRRKDDLTRRERELKQKFKNLNVKRKLLAKNQSEDLKRAIERWNASLIDEQESLAKERQQLEGWKEELGIQDKKIDMSFLPFVGQAPTEIQKIQLIEAKKFFKLAEEKKSLLEEKETLYKHHSEVSTMLNPRASQAPLSEAVAGAETEKLRNIQEEITRLEKELQDKASLYEKQYGKSIFSSFAGGMRKSLDKSLDVLNPFDSAKSGSQDVQQLLEYQMHLKEQIAAQEALVQTLAQAFDAQIALREQKRLMSELGVKEKSDPNQLRKTARELERKIRAGYEEIEERHKHKKQLLSELNQELKEREKNDNFALWATRKAVSPATGTAKLVKAFFVGLPHEDVELTKTASKLEAQPDTARIKALEEEIRNESLLMDAKNNEINNQRKELEILKAQASLAGGYKFRSVFVDVPYVFFNEAMEGARRIVPKKNREALLINRMNEETKKLEKLRVDYNSLGAKIEKAGTAPKSEVSKSLETSVSQAETETAKTSSASEEVMKSEIEAIQRQLEAKELVYKQQRELAENTAQASGVKKEPAVLNEKQSKKLAKELREIEESLQKLIRKETKLEGEETEILEKRIQHIDKTMKKTHSKAMTQDLLTEKERMEQRLSELESRRDFLSQEFKRFESISESSNPRV